MTEEGRRRMNDAGIHLMIGFRGTRLDDNLKYAITKFSIGGIILFRRNIENPPQLQDLLEGAQAFALETLERPLWVAIDQEGGPVQRLVPPFLKLPSASDLARLGPDAVVEWSTKAADELRGAGIQINLAPVLDVIPQGKSHFLEARSLGSDPRRVAQLGRLWIESLQQNGVSATAKHYPGLGQAELDPHHFAPVIRWRDDEAMQRDLEPFHEAIRGGVHCVMTSHALYPYIDSSWPATLSPRVNDEWLRRRLGFRGILLSDDMDMEAVSRKYTWEEMVRQGMQATIDFFLLCQRPENIEPFYRALQNAIDQDTGLANLHLQSIERIQRLFNLHHISISNLSG